MTWLVSLLVACICGVLGMLHAGVIANACVSWYQVSSREGESGYFVIFIAMGGGIAGLIPGLIGYSFVDHCLCRQIEPWGKWFVPTKGLSKFAYNSDWILVVKTEMQ